MIYFLALTKLANKLGLQWSDCVGFGSDGASSMVGQHNSVWSRIKQESPNCQLNKCVPFTCPLH